MSQEKSASAKTAQIRKQAAQQASYTCPMHPEVTSDKPGECPKCGMSLVKTERSENTALRDKITRAKSLVKEVKDELIQSGNYNCCINDPCNVCAMEHQSCDCHEDLKANKPVCNECYAGWQRGDGADKKVKPSSVRTSYKKHSH
jgi:hypothetical protein